MPTPYAGVDNFDATVPLVSGLDKRRASSVSVLAQAIANRTMALFLHKVDATTLSTDSDVLVKALKNGWAATPANWTRGSGDGFAWLVGVNTAEILTYEIDLPHGAFLSEISISVEPRFVGRGGAPANPPQIDLYSYDASQFPPTPIHIATKVDTNTGSGAAYETPHLITMTGLTQTINRKKVYTLAVTTEHGAGAQLNGLYYNPIVTATIAALDKAAG